MGYSVAVRRETTVMRCLQRPVSTPQCSWSGGFVIGDIRETRCVYMTTLFPASTAMVDLRDFEAGHGSHNELVEVRDCEGGIAVLGRV